MEPKPQADKFIIYHNPRCTKSRNACQLIDTKGFPFEVREYLKDPLTAAEIKALLKKLNLTAHNIIRTNEEIYKLNFKGKELTNDQWIHVLVQYPILIERPIVVKGDRAVIARPIENLEVLF